MHAQLRLRYVCTGRRYINPLSLIFDGRSFEAGVVLLENCCIHAGQTNIAQLVAEEQLTSRVWGKSASSSLARHCCWLSFSTARMVRATPVSM